MKILVINSGSSSLKYQLRQMPEARVLLNAAVERIGLEDSRLTLQWRDAAGDSRHRTREAPVADHRAALAQVDAALREAGMEPAVDAADIIAHRVVHGGESFQGPVLIDDQVMAAIRATCRLAPLHNPANLAGIELCREAFARVPQVAVFDTAFHYSLPPQAYRYAVPADWFHQHGVRRYGFHGMSHASVLRQTAAYLNRPPASFNLISLHLGNGASAAAIRAGRCVDTSMGLTPLEGLVMGTRSGDIDPAILFHMAREADLELPQLEAALNRQSGLKGLCGSNDVREIQRSATTGDAAARLALEIYCYRIKKYVGAYTAVLGKVDVLAFTAGVGENSASVRAQVCGSLESLGIVLDQKKNDSDATDVREIQSARVKILVVPADEAGEIARQAFACVSATTTV